MFFRFTAALLLTVGSAFAGGINTLNQRGTYASGVFDEGVAEIGAFDPNTDRFFIVNGDTGQIDVLDLSDVDNPTVLFSIDLSPYGAGANSVAVANGIVAAAVEADEATDPGSAVFFDANGNFLNEVTVGALPDMIIFTPDGNYVLTANEGEPNDAYTVDPEGSVSVINIANGVGSATVQNATFTAFNGANLDSSIRIFGPGATVAEDLEPEYIAISPDSTTAFVACQENNALAIVDIATGTVSDLLGLGFKDHSIPGNGIDASDRDDAININTWPLLGMYQPDAIDGIEVNGQFYLITANEGDARDYDGFSEEDRIKDLVLDPVAFPDAATLQEDENIGRLETTTTLGDDDNDGDFDRLFAYGARSFTVWNGTTGALVYDSGDDIEQLVASELPTFFNSTNDDNDSFDSRSDAKGPEPEGVETGMVAGVPYAFVGLERIGGFLVVDMSNPNAPSIIDYINNRDFTGDPEMGTAGDLAPEGLTFIPAADSPTNQPLLVVMFEVSGTATVYEIEDDCATPEIVFVAPIGQSGITIEGTPYCVYEISITDGAGNTTVYPVPVDETGFGELDVLIGEDFRIGVWQVGAIAPSDEAITVPTLQTWGLMVMVTILMGAAVVVNRRRRLNA